MKKYVYYLLIIFSLFSCSERPVSYFAGNACKSIILKDSLILNGEIIVRDIFGAIDIEVVDGYVVLITPRKENVFCVYNLQGDSLSAFGVRGNGPNDLVNCRLNGQREIEGGNALMWINDVSSARLNRLNITQSVVRGSCLFDKIISTYPMSMNAFFISDSLILAENMGQDNFHMISYNPLLNKEISSEQLYSPSVKEGVFSYYKSAWRISNDKNRMVSVMFSINEVNFWNRYTGSRFSCSIGPFVPIDKLVDEKTQLEKQTYYCDVKTTDRFVYALYMNQSHDIAYLEEKPMEVHVFDWDGQFVKRFILPQYILGIAVDADDKMIYGLEEDSAIYKYNIGNYLN